MSEKLKKLVVVEFTVDEQKTHVFESGYKYSYFYDEKTGKYYNPKSGYTVTGNDLSQLFDEVES